MADNMPENWKKNEPAMKAIQVAFDLDEVIGQAIKIEAAKNDLSPSAQIRKMLGLNYSTPKRPRLTTSLSKADYQDLAGRFGMDPDNELDIRHKIIEELAVLVKTGTNRE